MEYKDLLQIYLMSGQKIDSLWEFFVTIHLAIFGIFFLIERVKNNHIIIFYVSYILFAVINLRAKIYEYNFIISIYSELKESTHNLTSISKYFLSHQFTDRIFVTLFVHIFAFLCVSLILFMQWQKNKKAKCEQ